MVSATATVEGTRKIGTRRKTWRDEVEEGLTITAIKDRQAMVRDRREWMKVVLEAKVQNGL